MSSVFDEESDAILDDVAALHDIDSNKASMTQTCALALAGNAFYNRALHLIHENRVKIIELKPHHAICKNLLLLAENIEGALATHR